MKTRRPVDHATAADAYDQAPRLEMRQVRSFRIIAAERLPRPLPGHADLAGDFTPGHRPVFPERVQDLHVPGPQILGPAAGPCVFPVLRRLQFLQVGQARRCELLPGGLGDALSLPITVSLHRQPQPLSPERNRVTVDVRAQLCRDLRVGPAGGVQLPEPLLALRRPAPRGARQAEPPCAQVGDRHSPAQLGRDLGPRPLAPVVAKILIVRCRPCARPWPLQQPQDFELRFH